MLSHMYHSFWAQVLRPATRNPSVHLQTHLKNSRSSSLRPYFKDVPRLCNTCSIQLGIYLFLEKGCKGQGEPELRQAQKSLGEDLAEYGGKNNQVVKLLQTLASNPILAKYVLILELRESPRWIAGSEEHVAFSRLTSQALQNCVNLRSCTLTRDGIFDKDAIHTIQSSCSRSLRELEINGRTKPYYDVKDLLGFTKLERLSVIMADRHLIQSLPLWTSITSDSLKLLSLISKDSPFLTDQLLREISKNVPNLTQLQLVGNNKVTDIGVAAVLACTMNLESLTIHGVSPLFDMRGLSTRLDPSSGCLRKLKAISVNFPSHPPDRPPFFDALIDVLLYCPLESFTMLTPGGELSENLHFPLDFVSRLVFTHGHRLRTFAVQRVQVGNDAIEALCRGCPQLMQLFVGLSVCDEEFLGNQLSQLSHLHSLHLSYSPRTMNPIQFWQQDRILELVRRCSNSLIYIGFMTRVLEVRRIWSVEARSLDGTTKWKPEPGISLEPYAGAQIPEAFLVMK